MSEFYPTESLMVKVEKAKPKCAHRPAEASHTNERSYPMALCGARADKHAGTQLPWEAIATEKFAASCTGRRDAPVIVHDVPRHHWPTGKHPYRIFCLFGCIGRLASANGPTRTPLLDRRHLAKHRQTYRRVYKASSVATRLTTSPSLSVACVYLLSRPFNAQTSSAMYYVSPSYVPSHIASPVNSRRAAQPQVATPSSHHSTPAPISPINFTRYPPAALPMWVSAPDCLDNNSAHHSPSLPHRSPHATGYPYLPHNPTLVELEACTRRIHAVKIRHRPTVRFECDLESSHLGVSHCLSNQPGLHFPELADEGDLYDAQHNEESDSSGPETPHSPITGLWREAKVPFSLPEHSRLAPKTPVGTPTVVQNNVNETSGVESPRLTAINDFNSDPESSTSSDNRAIARAAIEEILYELNSCVLKFTMPTNLEFTVPKSGDIFPQLPYTTQNKPLIHHKYALDAFLDRLDNIKSYGDIGIRTIRKRAVEEVNESMEELNRKQSMAWFVVSIIIIIIIMHLD